METISNLVRGIRRQVVVIVDRAGDSDVIINHLDVVHSSLAGKYLPFVMASRVVKSVKPSARGT